MRTGRQAQLDPLFVIFEQHLYNFEDSDQDRKVFISNVVSDYLLYLRKLNITIPKSLEELVIDELAGQVNSMLVKKIYGCLSIDEFQKKVSQDLKKKVKHRYAKLGKS